MKLRATILSLLFFSILLSSYGCRTSGATTGHINGMTYFRKVNGSTTNIVARAATVTITGPESFVLTSNSSGIFEVLNVKPGSYNVVVDFSTSTDFPASFEATGGLINSEPYTDDVSNFIMIAYHREVVVDETTGLDFFLIGK